MSEFSSAFFSTHTLSTQSYAIEKTFSLNSQKSIIWESSWKNYSNFELRPLIPVFYPEPPQMSSVSGCSGHFGCDFFTVDCRYGA